MGAFVNTDIREITSFRHIRLSDIFNREGAKVAKIFSFFRLGYSFVLWPLVIAVPTACKHLYGIGRYDPVKIVFLGALGVLSEAGGKYAFTLENT